MSRNTSFGGRINLPLFNTIGEITFVCRGGGFGMEAGCLWRRVDYFGKSTRMECWIDWGGLGVRATRGVDKLFRRLADVKKMTRTKGA